MLISVVNNSTLISNSDLDLSCQAIQIQFDLHAAPAWFSKAPTIKFYADAKTVPGYSWLFSIIDSDTSVPDALGYHTEIGNRVDAFIMAKPVLDAGGVVLFDPHKPQNVSVSSVLSHEALEAFGDRYANTYCDNGNTSWALELCDPVEANSYHVVVNGTNVSLSDFVFPSFFNPMATAAANMPFNYMKTLTKPFTLDKGGYAITRTGGPGSETQIFGERPAWKSANPLSRSHKRQAKS